MMGNIDYADMLEGMEYREDHEYDNVFKEMKKNNFVAVFGYSDDLMEMRGAIDDEISASKQFFNKSGLIQNRCDDDRCPYFEEIEKKWYVEPEFAPESPRCTFMYHSNIPNEDFRVFEGDEVYCYGIVFCLDDLK